MLKTKSPMARLVLMRRALLAATPFAIIGALYISNKSQVLGLVVIAAFFLIAVRFAKLQEKVEAQVQAQEAAAKAAAGPL